MGMVRKILTSSIVAIAATVTGCQSSSMPNLFSGRLNPFTSAAKSTPGQQNSTVASSSKVSSANDPTSLTSKTPKFGPDLYVEAAKMQESRGNPEGAIQQYKKAVDLGPNNVSTLLNFARFYDRQSKFTEAVQLYQRATQADPKSATAHNDMVCVSRVMKIRMNPLHPFRRRSNSSRKKRRIATTWQRCLLKPGVMTKPLPQLIAAHGEQWRIWQPGIHTAPAKRPDPAGDRAHEACSKSAPALMATTMPR